MELRKRFLGLRDGGKAHCATAWCVRLLSASETCLLVKEGKNNPKIV